MPQELCSQRIMLIRAVFRLAEGIESLGVVDSLPHIKQLPGFDLLDVHSEMRVKQSQQPFFIPNLDLQTFRKTIKERLLKLIPVRAAEPVDHQHHTNAALGRLTKATVFPVNTAESCLTGIA